MLVAAVQSLGCSSAQEAIPIPSSPVRFINRAAASCVKWKRDDVHGHKTPSLHL